MPVVTIRAKRYEFQPSEITLKEGQKVKLIFISDDVPHGISVTELGISAEISKNHPTQMIIRPTTLGKFEGVCSRYCGAGHDTMRLVVNVT
jgi:cytochrome c oxidase subunit 2